MEASEGFAAVAQTDARILILGSLPGRKSLLEQQYYAHPRNAFWPIMNTLYGIGGSYQARCQGLIENKIALWDVLRDSQRPGSLDADIRIASANENDFPSFLLAHPSLRLIAFNGRKAEQLFQRMVRLPTSCTVNSVSLPSTSPAFAGMSIPAKIAVWKEKLALIRTQA